ncbi:MAG: hypothetical protein NC548_56165 [Lachnospiraceae bacterium]|nr:hypothetical protein [Lachnospiraceae bacterium]
MRVKGSINPDVVDVTAYEPIPGKAEVKIRENITSFTETDPVTEEEVTGFVYDEYTFILDNAIGLRKTILDNLEDWLITGRTLEVAPNATLYLTAKDDAVDEYTAELVEGGLL